MIKRIKIGIAIMPVLVLPFFGLSVFAEGLNSHAAAIGEVRTANTIAQNSDNTTANTTEHPKLEAARLKVCTNKQSVVNKITANKAKEGQQIISTFSKIATNVESFYQSKNLTSSDYASTLSNVDAQKVAAQAAVDKVAGDQVTFKCDGTDHPKSVVEGLQADLKAERMAIHSYHESITNLIKVVRAAKSTTTEGAQ